MKILRHADFKATVLYQSALEEELEWRKEANNQHDVELIDQLLSEIKQLGYNYKYYVDITKRDNEDKELARIVLRYIGSFDDEWISAQLVSVVGRKGNTFATKTILNNYYDSSEENKHINAFYYDNALARIQDKKCISSYLEILKNPNYAIKFPFTMIMLGKWRVEDAQPYFMQYLDSSLLYHNSNIGDLVFISLEALSYYPDLQGVILQAFEKKLQCEDADLKKAASRAIKRLKKITPC